MKSKLLAGAILALCAQLATAAETVKIASLDMLSGPLAGFGQSALKHWQFLADKANTEGWAGDTKFEIVPFDTKMSPQEALSLLQQVSAQNIRYVVQGASSSAVGIALEEAIEKHNQRNPGKEIVYLNYASATPVMTNEKCSYWHFRTDANIDMKIKAMVTHMAADKTLKRVFMLNPNYAYGQDAARFARRYMMDMRPDVEIVGDDYHAMGQVKDFSPYIAKIMAAKADALITVAFGNDLALMVRAANDAGMKDTSIYTVAGSSPGMGIAYGEPAVGRVKLVIGNNMNDERFGATKIATEYKQRFKEDFFFGAVHTGMRMLSSAIREAKGSDPVAVARKLEGMKLDGLAGPVEMRKEDHQLQMPIYIDSWAKVDGKRVKLDQDGTGFGWRTDAIVPNAETSLPTTCAMKRP
ncbi:branched-chain amino acid ABC transporter substrate-binding protein [Variovorax robiniae]|uniref:Branched-chain amino acid ABC transporter substrate-binding protein n=1 Tax=Variovorax robiniae TaxID=1836199 RepID=A0ABU8XHV3_9BURK